MSTITQTPPDFSNTYPPFQKIYEDFFKRTDDYKSSEIKGYSRGVNLTDLVAHAREVCKILEGSNPFCTHLSSEEPNAIQAVQWHLDHLSDIKLRVAGAILHKKAYYTSSCIGIITRYFLQFFRMWNNGKTAAIATAEKFLCEYDSRRPVVQFVNQDSGAAPRTTLLNFFANISLDWILKNKLDTNFYNYPKYIKIEVGFQVP
jgi:hypothetical protein